LYNDSFVKTAVNFALLHRHHSLPTEEDKVDVYQMLLKYF